MFFSYLVEKFWPATVNDSICTVAYCLLFSFCFLTFFFPDDRVFFVNRIVLCDFRNFFVGVTVWCSCCACIINCKSPPLWIQQRSTELDFLLMKFHQFSESQTHFNQWDFGGCRVLFLGFCSLNTPVRVVYSRSLVLFVYCCLAESIYKD